MTTDTTPQYVVVKNMYWEGEITIGEWNGTYYVMDDGDCYLPDNLKKYYESEFFDELPTTKGEDIK